MSNYYDDLGVEKNASADEIKKAYRNLAFKYHPDRNPGDKSAEEMFKKINAAYEVLGNDEKRRNYDLMGQTDYSNYNAGNANTYSNPFGNDETFWDWFNGQSGGYNRGYTNNSYNTSDEESNSYRWENSQKENYTRNNYVSMFIAKFLQTLFGVFMFRFSFFIIPFGFLICIAIIANGVKGMIASVRGFKRLK